MPHYAYQKHLLQAITRNAPHYKNIRAIIEEIGLRLLSRLAYFKYPPKKILDLGSGQGLDTYQLSQAYPESEIIAVDFCQAQFSHYEAQLQQNPLINFCIASAPDLPFPDKTFDLLFSNLLLPAIHDYPAFWSECKRVLKPGGILLLSTLGTQSFIELQTCFNDLNVSDSMNTFPKLSEMGDSLMQAGFDDPVIESEHLTLYYRSLHRLLTELKNIGSIKIWEEYPEKMFKSKFFWMELEKYYRKNFLFEEKKLPLSLEIYFLIAFAPTKKKSQANISHVFLNEIKKKI